MGRIEDLRAELDAAEAEESMVRVLGEARERYRSDPTESSKAAMQAAARKVRELREATRVRRAGGAQVNPDVAGMRAEGRAVGGGVI